MKKIRLFAAAFWLIACLCACGGNIDGIGADPGVSGVSGTSDTSGSVETSVSADIIIRSAAELDERVAYMCENCLSSVKVTLRDLDVWNELMEYYKEKHDILVMRGLSKMEMSYEKYAGYINAELIPTYETYVRVAVAYKNKSASGLSGEEKEVYDRAVKVIGDVVPKGGTVFEKEIAVHDYIAGKVAYDPEQQEESFGVYGALVKGRAVCSGYAEAFKMLMNMLGAECLLVTGEAGGIGHAWNLVNLNGEWYHVDVTWDDADEARLTHRYMNVSDDVLSYDHAWNSGNYKSANYMKYNYYKYTGKEVFSASQLSKEFTSAFNRGQRSFEAVCAYGFEPGDLAFLSELGEGYYSDSPYGKNIFLSVDIKG